MGAIDGKPEMKIGMVTFVEPHEDGDMPEHVNDDSDDEDYSDDEDDDDDDDGGSTSHLCIHETNDNNENILDNSENAPYDSEKIPESTDVENVPDLTSEEPSNFPSE